MLGLFHARSAFLQDSLLHRETTQAGLAAPKHPEPRVDLIHIAATSASMEAQDAHEDILVIGQVGHSLDILDMGMLQKKHSLYKYILVHTCTYSYIHVRTSMYVDIPLELDTRCCPYFPTVQFREPCVVYCVLSRNSNQPFLLSSLADSSGGDRGGQLPFGASREGQPLKDGTGEMRYSSPCIE